MVWEGLIFLKFFPFWFSGTHFTTLKEANYHGFLVVTAKMEKPKNQLSKIKVTPLASESFGVRSMCTLIETPDLTMLFGRWNITLPIPIQPAPAPH